MNKNELKNNAMQWMVSGNSFQVCGRTVKRLPAAAAMGGIGLVMLGPRRVAQGEPLARGQVKSKNAGGQAPRPAQDRGEQARQH